MTLLSLCYFASFSGSVHGAPRNHSIVGVWRATSSLVGVEYIELSADGRWKSPGTISYESGRSDGTLEGRYTLIGGQLGRSVTYADGKAHPLIYDPDKETVRWESDNVFYLGAPWPYGEERTLTRQRTKQSAVRPTRSQSSPRGDGERKHPNAAPPSASLG